MCAKALGHTVCITTLYIFPTSHTAQRGAATTIVVAGGGDEEALGYYRNPEHCLIGCVINLHYPQESPIFNNGILP